MLCLALGDSGGVTGAQLGTGTLGHQGCHHVSAVVVTLTLSINLTGGDWDSPGGLSEEPWSTQGTGSS